MKRTIRHSRAYQLFIALCGVLVFVIINWQYRPVFNKIEVGLITVLAVGVLTNFPLRLMQKEITLLQTVVIGSGLLFGPTFACWTTAVGILLGYGFQYIRTSGRQQWKTSNGPVGLEIVFSIGMQLVPLAAAFTVFPWQSDQFLLQQPFPVAEVVILSVIFALIHSILFLVDYLLRRNFSEPNFNRDLISLSLIELLPLPFVVLSGILFPDSQLGALIALSSIPTILAVLIHGLNTTQLDLERRLQDLSTLNNISSTLRSTLDMDNLLAVIQQQVTQLLKVDNFYVALYDLSDRCLWYPLAVKGGQRQEWPRRPLTDRLTDRVIREKRPIFLAQDAQQELERIGLPPSETAPYAWLGVPLITSDQTIGCLAAFSTSPDVAFNPGDRDLLIILSGQVSVAIENALLYNQTQGRAAQLENLNRISSLITASLDPQEVLAQVCRSVTQVSDSQRSAIFLIDSDQGEVRLAYAHELSGDFVYEHRKFPLVDDIRTRCLRTGRPTLTPNINTLPPNHTFTSTLENENISAYGDFPLITPRGQIGFLSVYFDQPHAFNPEEVELLQTFASQAAIAVSNARLYAQTDMALSRRAHQLAILENIGRELAAATHSGRLFEIILDNALEFTNSPWGSLNILDANTKMIDIKASRGYQLETQTYSEMEGIAGRVLRTRQAEIISDVTQDADYIDLTGGAARSQLSVPLVHEDKVLGVLTVESPKQDAFTSNDQSFISQLATQAAIALVNASLYDETRRRLRDQASLYSVTKRLVGNLSLEHVIRSVIQAINETLESQVTGIYLWDEISGAFILRASTDSESESSRHLPPFIEDNLWKRLTPIKISTGLLQITNELAESGPFIGNCQRCQALILPLEISDQRLGFILSHLPQDLTLEEEDLQLPKSVAAQGAIAIQNALLFSDVMKGRERLEAVLDSVEEGVLMVNANGVIILGNASVQKIAEISLDDILGKSLTQLPVHIQRALGLTPKQAENLVATLGTDRRSSPSKITIKNANEKSDKVLERFIAPVMGQGRRPIGWVFVLRDISEEHQLNQARDLITETLVHDLRSPMGAVSSALTLLEDILPEGDHDQITYQSIDIAQRSTNRVMSLIESLLDISRMEAGSIHLELSTFDLHSLATELFAEFKPQANDLGILMRNDVNPSTPPVHADREKITRVLTNLFDNALKFTPEGGLVKLSAETLNNQILAIKVSDTGPGIPHEFREQIFERFTQVPGQKGRRRGSGIGLTFCRLAVEAHGGRIWVEPTDDEGSTFTFTLPIASYQASTP